ncbi:MAG: lysophospholipid acyltransferase family protein [Candidatus Omnitrophota bacterium]|nr:lysophospholipid acyltransferase family protein [Candidatus Omnitrophota bacterium]
MYYLFIIGRKLALALPRKLCYAVARILAIIQFHCSSKDRNNVIYNLTPVLGSVPCLRHSAREVFINFAYYLSDFFRYAKLNAQFIERYVRIEGLEYLDKALQEKKGVIVVSAHLGNYELGGAVVALRGYPCHVIALPHSDERLTHFFVRQRELAGLRVVSTGITVKRCIQILKQGGIVGVLGDRDFTREGSSAQIFSRSCLLPRGAAFFARKTAAAVIPCFFVRDKKYYYRLIIEKPIVYDVVCPDIESCIMSAYAKILERYIEQYPEQWYVFQKYWKE